MRSESNSEPPSGSFRETPLEDGGVLRKSQHLSRKRTLRRGCFIEPLQEKHFKYLWAAYKLGRLGGFHIEENLDPLRFKAWWIQAVSSVIGSGGEVIILSGSTPIGISVIGVAQPEGARRQLYPHVFWFGGSSRNKLECLLKFAVELKQEGNLTVTARPEDWRFFDHLCKYGCLRAIGKFRGFFEDGSDAMLYQGVN